MPCERLRGAADVYGGDPFDLLNQDGTTVMVRPLGTLRSRELAENKVPGFSPARTVVFAIRCVTRRHEVSLGRCTKAQ